MTDCIELASRLGKAIAGSPQAVAYRDARKAVEAEPELSKTLEAYQQQMAKIAQLEDEQKAIEVEDKQKLQQLNQTLVSSGPFKKLTAAQVEWVDLMRKVNESLRKELLEIEA